MIHGAQTSNPYLITPVSMANKLLAYAIEPLNQPTQDYLIH